MTVGAEHVVPTTLILVNPIHRRSARCLVGQPVVRNHTIVRAYDKLFGYRALGLRLLGDYGFTVPELA